MKIMILLIFTSFGAGLFSLLCGLLRLPTLRTGRAMSGAGKKERPLAGRFGSELPSDNRGTVLLPVTSGRQRIYGESSLLHGQATKKDRTFRKKHSTDADRIRMQCTCDNVNKDTSVRPRQKDDTAADPVYELQCQDAHICILCSGIFP